MLIKNGQHPPEINDDDSHLNEDLESYNNLLGLGGTGSLNYPDSSCLDIKQRNNMDSNSSFVADEKKEVQLGTTESIIENN
jgi:hypothetical protein